MVVTTEMIKEVREASNAPLIHCKKILGETDGDVRKAINLLEQQGYAKYDENGFDNDWVHKVTGTKYDELGFNKDGSIHIDTRMSVDNDGYNRKHYKQIEIDKAQQKFLTMSLNELLEVNTLSLSHVYKSALQLVLSKKVKEVEKKAFKEKLQSDNINPMISSLMESYSSALNSIDNEIRKLFNEGKDMTALMHMNKQLSIINDIYDIAIGIYSTIYRSSNTFEYYNSRKKDIKRLPMISFFKDEIVSSCDIDRATTLLKENYSIYKDDSDKLYSDIVIIMLKELGYANEHWYLKDSFINELEYMLDFLKVFIEVDYMPISDETEDDSNKQDRYIPKDVKIAVWRRDQGKCVECNSKEKLEYDHIIPVSKGGSNTERNVQLLCEKCNRQKSATIQ